MKYGERLKLARGERTQEWLASEARVSQSLIWQLENSQTAKGSQYTNRFARVLEVSADWLADEIGEMVPASYTVYDPKAIVVARAVEQQAAEYVKDAAVSAVLTTCELAERAKANGTGTHG